MTMREIDQTVHRFGPHFVRLDTLMRLRWLAILGQGAAVTVVSFGLGFEMPTAPAYALIALSAWSNVFLRIRFSRERRLPEWWTAVILGFDILQLAGLLFLTGGLQNPFALLIIAPVMVSATSLSAQRTIGLGVLVVLSATLLAFEHLPVPWYPDTSFSLPLLYVAAVWIALICSLAFMGAYAFRVAEEGRQLANALAATDIVLAREQNLHALDGLAAAAAHELGTPLATITVVAKELKREIGAGSPHAEDLALLSDQAERCRDILRKLATLGADEGAPIERMRLKALVEEVVEPSRLFDVDLQIELDGEASDEPVFARSPAILYGLGNIVENAVDFARTTVRVEARWSAARVTLAVSDDGEGFPGHVLERLGDPYVTTRSEGGTYGGGLGLGFFIAKTLLERTGATVGFANKSAPSSGAVVTVSWPRQAVDITRRTAGEESWNQPLDGPGGAFRIAEATHRSA